MKLLRTVATVFLASTGLACSTVTSLLRHSATLTPAPTQRPMRQGKVIYSQDFNTPDDELWNMDDGSMLAGQADNGYRVLIRKPAYGSGLPLLYGESMVFPDDLIINVDVTKQAGPADSTAEVACRWDLSSGEIQEVFFSIDENGKARIVIIRDSKVEHSATENLVEIGVPFHTGLATNRLHIECIGSDAALYINGRFALETQTDLLHPGTVHLSAGTDTEGGADYLYDNLEVQQPE